jgi:DNA-binding NarL/FixJ family response regulator
VTPTPPVVRVLLVEDNDVYRSSLELLLGLQQGLEVVGAVGTGSEAADAATRLRADVVLMDFRLPGAAVVCLTAEASAEEREEILRAGARSLVEKGDAIEALAAAIRSAADPESIV